MINVMDVIRLIIPVFCLATMFSMGLDLKLDDILAPFRNWLALVIIVLTNNVLIPLLGFLLIVLPESLNGTPLAGLAEQIVPLVGGQKIGFLLCFLAAGSLLGPVLVQLSGVPIPFAKGVMVVLVGVSALLVPVELALFTQASTILPHAAAIVPAGGVFLTVLLYQLVPLGVGILVNSQYNVIAVWLRPLIVQLTGFTLLIALAALMTSELGLISVPGNTPPMPTPVITTTVTVSTENIAPDIILDAVKDKLGQDFPNNTALQKFLDKSKWVIFDAATSYIITPGGSVIKPTLIISPVNQLDTQFTITGSAQEIVNHTIALNAGQFSATLVKKLEALDIQSLDAKHAIVIQPDTTWLLVQTATTYFVAAEDDPTTGTAILGINQELPEPPGLIGAFLKTLAALPVVGPAIDFLTKLIIVLVPYALFGAVAALLLVIGYYCGVAVRSIVGVTDAAIPRTLAMSTGVRNVSMALIIATQHLLGQSTADGADLGQDAIVIVLAFFLVSLIMSAIQATRWAGQPDTAPVMPASQAQAAVIAPERGATSTP